MIINHVRNDYKQIFIQIMIGRGKKNRIIMTFIILCNVIIIKNNYNWLGFFATYPDPTGSLRSQGARTGGRATPSKAWHWHGTTTRHHMIPVSRFHNISWRPVSRIMRESKRCPQKYAPLCPENRFPSACPAQGAPGESPPR